MHNPSRRSKNIGRTQGGRVKNGTPWEKLSRFEPRLEPPTSLPWSIRSENPSREYYHPCTPAEINEVLAKLPASLTQPLASIVLRRSPRKARDAGLEAMCRGSMIELHAFPVHRQIPWPCRPTPSEHHHYEVWATWSQQGDRWTLLWSEPQVKRYYLYHLLLHEVGHLHDSHHTRSCKREAFAENFALEWARKLGALP